VGKGPFATFDVVFLGHGELEQVADGGGEHIVVALEIVTRAREPAQCLGDVLGDGGFLGDDELLGQWVWVAPVKARSRAAHHKRGSRH
jgi:hypothetical protein